jgi:ATP-dependent Lhr-like helicase
VADADAAMLALETEGVVLRGRFTPDATELEWCDRALLSRIHRYTLNRLRAEIEPVSPADFMRFLFSWQHVDAPDRLTGLDGLREVIARLDGFELAAGAWERAVLPARVAGYDAPMLDMLCLAGEVGWARLSAPVSEAGAVTRLVPATPIALFLREHSDAWQALRTIDADAQAPVLSDHARAVVEALHSRGASFFTDLSAATSLDAEDLRQAIGVLVASGLVVSDGFSGLRALVWAARGRPAVHDRRTSFAGRWTALRSAPPAAGRDAAIEAQAWTLLRRYGLVFRRLLERETNTAPWRELARVYRRLEARGEIRGGRFVSGMSGEQFALPEAVSRLRDVRRTPASGRLITISTADPLNLAGIVTTGDRVRIAGRNRIVYRDGVPLAVMEGDCMRELAPMDAAVADNVSRALNQHRIPALLRS